MPQVISGAATWATGLLNAANGEPVRRALLVAVAELHVEAGWAGFDAGLYARAMHHYAQALELATEAGDAYLKALALGYAGLATIERGHPDDGLKMLQYGQIAAWAIPSDEPRAVVVGELGRAAVEASGLADCSAAYADLGDFDGAERAVGKAQELWTPSTRDTYGDVHGPAARLELRRGRLDRAETLAAAAVRRWAEAGPVSRTQSGIVLATIHVRAGEPRGLTLAHVVIRDADGLSSVRARQRLLPLAVALEARPGSDAAELARQARRVAA